MTQKIPARMLLLVILLLIFSSVQAEKNNTVKINKLTDVTAEDLRVRATLSSADTCIVRHDQGLIWEISGWLIGNELYKSYLDPSLSCENPYPYSVTEINMPMFFHDTMTFVVSVDVEAANLSNPSCPFPDSILGISASYEFSVPTAGLYNIWVPFDAPIVVDGPFFAGFYIGAISHDSLYPSLVVDSNLASICVSYNIWDDSIGFIDLMNNQFYNFPGQLVLYASGITGGGAAEPEPSVSILSPLTNTELYRSSEIWAMEESGSSIIEYVSFSYSDGGDFVEIYRDYDGYSVLRDETSDGGSGDGYSTQWDFSNLSEGDYTIRVTAVDTMGRSASDEIAVSLEPTPPIPMIASPADGSFICDDINILMSVSDENMLAISAFYKKSENSFSFGLNAVDETGFGSFYSAPIAAACVIEYWAVNKYDYLMQNGSTMMTVSELIEELALLMDVSGNSGAVDEYVYTAIKTYLANNGNVIIPKLIRDVDYISLRTEMEYFNSPVIAALGGSNGRWVAIDGFSSSLVNDSCSIVIVNQLTGTVDAIPLRIISGAVELQFDGSWQPIEMLISFQDYFGSVTQSTIGVDFNGLDGWSVNWSPVGLVDSSFYFIRSEGNDANAKKGYATILVQYDCSQSYLSGDINNDGVVNLADLTYLVAFYLNNGLIPVGGIQRADTNCDNHLNITDIIYLANYMFGGAAPPCN